LEVLIGIDLGEVVGGTVGILVGDRVGEVVGDTVGKIIDTEPGVGAADGIAVGITCWTNRCADDAVHPPQKSTQSTKIVHIASIRRLRLFFPIYISQGII
jgi:hypothetical protein